MDADLDPEDAKLIILARSAWARGRPRASSAAAVRDQTGRTYIATDVSLRGVSLTALQLAVAMAVSSGAEGLEAAAVVREPDDELLDRELGPAWEAEAARVMLAGTDGALVKVYLNPDQITAA
ncbi:cytidine deaminase [Actinospica sp.]|jgi:hypothetical protein|uniref:cytidine deaminase n=1 Tax=Actinospica sp. TaxID=1872142 RepID=UPI002CB819C1|nr:cytidine deaminase [Actinospica sp.]HWG27325.1 cytidine deaminase [Actinospica sp.]